MANPEHVEVVKKGKDAIEEWRKHNSERLDLAGTNLAGITLNHCDLSGAKLHNCILHGASFFGADLSLADLSGANLTHTVLNGADLTDANLSEANLSFSMCGLTIFLRANLRSTNATSADLRYANLSAADLHDADLSHAVLEGTVLDGADLTRATMRATVVADCDLSTIIGLDAIKHISPSSVGLDTLVDSIRGANNRLTPSLETFFIKTGVPQDILRSLPSMVSEIKYCSAFICYGQPDQSFAVKLVRNLMERGVSCWLYSMDFTVGERTWEEIGRVRREAEKMIVLCSMKALVRDGVLKEIEEQIDENPDKIVPVSLDELWKEKGFPVRRDETDLKPFLLERNIADFSKESDYKESLDRLLKGLERQRQ